MEVDIRDQFGRERTQPMEVAVGGSFGGGSRLWQMSRTRQSYGVILPVP